MNEQPTATNEALQKMAEQNKKMRKKLFIVVGIVVGVITFLMAVLLIVNSLKKDDEAVILPNSYFYPTYQGNIFAILGQFLIKQCPDVICSILFGMRHSPFIRLLGFLPWEILF